MQPPTRPILGYWKIRGLASNIRYQLAYCGVKFDQHYYEQGGAPEYSRADWMDVKYTHSLDFPNLPYFIDGGVYLTETHAIHLYIADKWNPDLLGKTPQERAKANMLWDIIKEVKTAVTSPCYGRANMEDAMKVMAEKLPAILKFKNGRKFIAGNDVIYVDFYFFEIVQLMAFVTQ